MLNQILEMFESYFSGDSLRNQLIVWGIGIVVYVILKIVSNVLFSNADKICAEKEIRPHECQYSIEWHLCLNRHNFAENIASCWGMLTVGVAIPMFLFYINRKLGIVAWIVLVVIVIANLVNRLVFDWITRYEYQTKYNKGYRYEIPYYPVWESSVKQTLFFETKEEFTTACEKIYRGAHIPKKVYDDLLINFKYYLDLEVTEDPFHYRFAIIPVYNTKFVEVVKKYEREDKCESFDDFRRKARVSGEN